MIIYAVNVHTGGGKILLDELIEGHTFGKISTLFVDSRYDSNRALELGIVVRPVVAGLTARIIAELDLQKIAEHQAQEDILFFGNLPPLRRLKNKTYLYLQSCFLLAPTPMPRDSWKVFLRTFVERLWLRSFISNVDEVWVQTNSMRNLFEPLFPKNKVSLKPFYPKMPSVQSQEKKYDLISVTSFSKHKNLNTLLQALDFLDPKLNNFIKVMIVIDGNKIPQEVLLKKYSKIELIFKNSLTRQQLGEIYASSHFNLVTSSYESFCLPLYEAAFYKVPTIALKTDFAKDSKLVTVFYMQNRPEDLAQVLAQQMGL